MKVEQWNVRMKRVVPSEGMYLSDGENVINEAYIPNDADENQYKEVGQAEKDAYEASKNPKTLVGAKQRKVQELMDYDSSTEVNSFWFGGELVWLNKADRVGLQNSLAIEKNAGKTESTMWFGGKPITIGIDKAIAILNAVELYALECYNVTARHKAEIEAKILKLDVDNYDFKTGYPEKLDFDRVQN